MKINNDILSIINRYADIEIKLKRDKFIIPRQGCRCCGEKIRYTKHTLTDIYLFPEIIKINLEFLTDKNKYIKRENLFFFYNGVYNNFDDSVQYGIITYTYDMFNPHIYGRYIIMIKDADIYAKRVYSIFNVFYDHINRNYKTDEYLYFFKTYKDNETEILNSIQPILNEINIVDVPYKSKENLCGGCRKRVKKGYIFI